MLAAVVSLVINEVLYDPPGPDSGHEFVEILNVSAAPVALAGLEVQAGDGARGSWRTAWRGVEGELASGALLVVGGDSVATRHRLQTSLQNGPDAVRLWQEGRVLDLLGYGALEDRSLFEGRPADDVADASLARIPDGHDTDDNAADFVRERVTPGRLNRPLREWRLALVEPDPTRLWPHRQVRVVARLHNAGLEPLEAGAFGLQAALAPLLGEPYLDGRYTGPLLWRETLGGSRALAPGDSASYDVTWMGALGLFEMTVETGAAGADTTNDSASLRLRIGAGAVLVSEILFAPAPGEPEWVELFNRDVRPHFLSGWTLADATGRRTVLRAGRSLAPMARALLAADTSSAVPGLPAGTLRVVAMPWPSLNNTDGEAGFADLLVLRDTAGVVQDALFYSAASGASRGRSIERLTEDPDARGLLWSPCKDPLGATPGRANSATSPPARGTFLTLEPNPFSPNGDGRDDLLGIHLEVPEGGEGFRIALFDLAGRRRRLLAADRLGPGPRRLVWDGLDDDGGNVEAGAYVLHLEFFAKTWSERVLRTVGLVR